MRGLDALPLSSIMPCHAMPCMMVGFVILRQNGPTPVKVPMTRLMKLNKPEWHYGILGCISSAGVGAVQPAFAFVIATMIR